MSRISDLHHVVVFSTAKNVAKNFKPIDFKYIFFSSVIKIADDL